MEDIIETWMINNRINIYLLNAIEKDEFLADKTMNKGRTVGQQFAHIHNVRLMWLNAAAPEFLENIAKIDNKAEVNKSILEHNLMLSGLAIEKLFKKGMEENKIKGFKPHPIAFLGYLIAHEAHHRGQLIVSLKTNGHAIDKKAGFGIWEWGTR